MSFTHKRQKGKEYLYFQAGREGTLYIMPKDSPTDVKVQNVEKALRYMQSRMKNDREIYERLLNLLPEENRKIFSDSSKGSIKL